jgi:hypothetical protein
LVLLGMQNRAFGSYLAAKNRVLISATDCLDAATEHCGPCDESHLPQPSPEPQTRCLGVMAHPGVWVGGGSQAGLGLSAVAQLADCDLRAMGIVALGPRKKILAAAAAGLAARAAGARTGAATPPTAQSGT